MDDRTYRRLTQETPTQRQRRHNGLVGPRIFSRRCRKCGGSGRRGNEADPKEDAICRSCDGTGTRTYRRD